MEDSPPGEAKSLDSPDAGWAFLDGSERVAVQLPIAEIGRGVYRPGWRWSEHAQPFSGGESEEHVGYVISGRMAVCAKDGTEVEVGPGEAFVAVRFCRFPTPSMRTVCALPPALPPEHAGRGAKREKAPFAGAFCLGPPGLEPGTNRL